MSGELLRPGAAAGEFKLNRSASGKIKMMGWDVTGEGEMLANVCGAAQVE